MSRSIDEIAVRIRNLLLIVFAVACTASHDEELHEQSVENP